MRHAQYFVFLDGAWECSDNACRATIDLNGSLTHTDDCKFNPERYGHDLARELLAKHGADRYPSAVAQGAKTAAEVGELIDAIFKLGWSVHQIHGDPQNLDQLRLQVRKEYGDAGHSLYELGNKLGISLLKAMAEVVDNETRRF